MSRGALSAGLLVLLVGLVGCTAAGGPAAQPDATVAPTDTATDTTGGDASDAAPEECATAFPQAFTAPDLAEVEALPAGWPDPPEGSTLCLTSSGLGEAAIESISYATEAAEAAVLAHYEQELAAYAVERTPSPTGGEMLTGDGAGIGFQVQPGEGSIVIVLQPAG